MKAPQSFTSFGKTTHSKYRGIKLNMRGTFQRPLASLAASYPILRDFHLWTIISDAHDVYNVATIVNKRLHSH